MAKLHHPKEITLNGPFLITQEDLESLDDLIQQIHDLLQKSWESYLKKEAENDLETQYKEHKRNNPDNSIKCTMTLNDRSQLSDNDIKGILKHNLLNTLSPTELHIKIIFGTEYENYFRLKVQDLFSDQLICEIECLESEIKDEITYQIYKWANKFKPSKLLQLWCTIGSTLGISCICITLFLVLALFENTVTSYNDILVNQAKEIINTGINTTNRDTALELLLKLNSEYTPDVFEAELKPLNPLTLRLTALFFFLSLILFVKPMTIFGIGKSQRKLDFYKKYIKVVSFTIPVALVIMPFWDTVTNWLYKIPH